MFKGLIFVCVYRQESVLVPHIVRSCVEEIERRGLKEEGIYRISGASTEIQALKHAFNTSECVCAGAQLHIC